MKIWSKNDCVYCKFINSCDLVRKKNKFPFNCNKFIFSYY